MGSELLALKGDECQNCQRWDKGSALCLSSTMHTRRLLDNDGECRQRHEQQHQQEENVGEGHDQALGMGDMHELLQLLTKRVQGLKRRLRGEGEPLMQPGKTRLYPGDLVRARARPGSR